MLCLSKEKTLKIATAIQEDEKRFQHYLKLLEEWISCHGFIPQNYDKRMLAIFLRGCKYNLEKTKNKLELYFVYKKRYPEAFGFHYFNAQERKALDNIYLFESKHVTTEGYRVGCAGFRSSDTSGCDMSVLTKLLSMFATYKANLDGINAGLTMVSNFSNLTPAIAASIINTTFKQLLVMIQTVYPFRIKGIYFIYVPSYAVPIANMVKLLFNEKIRNKINIEAGDDYMKKCIPSNCLPKEYGGTDGTIAENAKNFMESLQSTEAWFLEHAKVQIVGNIPKELYTTNGIDEDLGTQGSFRKLDID